MAGRRLEESKCTRQAQADPGQGNQGPAIVNQYFQQSTRITGRGSLERRYWSKSLDSWQCADRTKLPNLTTGPPTGREFRQDGMPFRPTPKTRLAPQIMRGRRELEVLASVVQRLEYLFSHLQSACAVGMLLDLQCARPHTLESKK